MINPFNQHSRLVPATAQKVHSIVFWSKNFGPFLAGAYDEALKEKGYNLFFNFTVNGENRFLEPHVPPIDERLRQLEILADRNDPAAINWRYDPICFYVPPFCAFMCGRVSRFQCPVGLTCVDDPTDDYRPGQVDCLGICVTYPITLQP